MQLRRNPVARLVVALPYSHSSVESPETVPALGRCEPPASAHHVAEGSFGQLFPSRSRPNRHLQKPRIELVAAGRPASEPAFDGTGTERCCTTVQSASKPGRQHE